MLNIAGNGFAMLLRFARAHPLTALIAALIYGGTAAISTETLAALLPPGRMGWYVASWVGSLPRTLLLAPILTVLLRFVVLGKEPRGYFTLDHRVARVLRVQLVLWAILFAGGIVPAFASDLLPRLMRGPGALAVFGITLLPKAASWWVALRLALAPTLAAAGTRPYPLDTSLAFTRGWLWMLLGIRLTIWLVYVVPLLVVATVKDWDAPTLAAMDAAPGWIAAMTALGALVELADAAAMALMTQRIVQSRAPAGDEQAEAR